ncbi:hypothetical protein CYY_007740 [Polysphondylium violaceum]|uniref:P-type ATPase A domain-containing protein n=1 Tax=Polysphondylium violaceum TaxID=133409 RepID=A0A8J4V4N7_9MYCE|nr:hypothetical protein CYY_007740 [Polysphondylium violaceum]
MAGKSVKLYKHKHPLAYLNVIPFLLVYSYLIYLYYITPIPITDIVNSNSTITVNTTAATELSSGDGSGEGVVDQGSLDINDTSVNNTTESGVAGKEDDIQVEFNLHIFLIALTVCLQAVSILFNYWSVNYRCYNTMTPVNDIQSATYAKVTPTSHKGAPQLCAINRDRSSSTSSPSASEQQVSIEFQKKKLVYNHEKKQFEKVKFNIPVNISEMVDSNVVRGYQTKQEIEIATMQYGRNRLDIPIPSFLSLYKEQAIAPFFVFQVFCVLLWCLEDYVVYCLFSLFMLLVFEATVVKSRISNLHSLRDMSTKPSYLIYVYRENQWIQINTTEILPGDLVSIGRGANEAQSTIPCDMILLSGGCVVNEAMLTGESTPHHKESLRDRQSSADMQQFDFKNDKIHILYGGTQIVQHTPSEKLSRISKSPDRGCLAYAVRTGFNTNQGRLMRTIWFSSERVTANNKESFLFILFLLMFAIAASVYLFNKGFEEKNRSKYKLLLNCIMVITSVVPPELPMELSLAVNNSLISLIRLGIYCTEPFRIPFAGKVDICCFDKTGTLTTDDLLLQGIASCPAKHHISPTSSTPAAAASSSSSTPTSKEAMNDIDLDLDDPNYLAKPENLDDTVQFILAGCHALVVIDNNLVGDPMETAGMKSIPWTCKGDKSVSNKKGVSVEVMHRFHFSSDLKRMGTICNVIYSSNFTQSTYAFVKGAPEIMKPFYNQDRLIDNYDESFKKYSRQGSRVLALGYKRLESGLNPSQLKSISRESVESNLEFAGFIIFDCPVKPDSKRSIEMLTQSSHKIVMITGDNSLTACHVAKQLNLMDPAKTTLILNGEQQKWISVDETISLDLEPQNAQHIAQLDKQYNLCLSGQSMGLVYDNSLFNSDLCLIRVFARVSPEQKQLILSNFKSNGHFTLMAGDGTNDVGALKQAHVGVAILNKGEFKPAPEMNIRQMMQQASHQAKMRKQNPAQAAQQAQEMAKKMQEEYEVKMVKLGDASIAAPFTSKSSAVLPITHIIRQGRCTLVTTFQMYKILALNSLITAYGLSVLYLQGVKLGDTQATISGMLIAFCFLFISTSKPLMSLAKKRPNPNLFSPYMMFSILLQFALHLSCLIFIVNQSHIREPNAKPDPDSPFSPNLLNSAVFLISNAMQVATFAVNYKGHPFMQSLFENKPLLYSLSFVWGLGLVLASEMIPDLNQFLELVPFPDSQFRFYMMMAIITDLVGAFIIEKVCSALFKN